jgi:hypothetical protein
MQLGYSLLLGEQIEALNINHRDCEKFQIVCPVCFEPVHKAIRQCIDGQKSHYLSHYNRDVESGEECEFRVDSLNHSSIAAANQIVRGQRLIYFLSVLSEAMEDDVNAFPPCDPANESYQREIMDGLAQSRVLDSLAMKAIALPARERELITEEEFGKLIDLHKESLPEELHYDIFETSYERDNQIRIARDIWCHLLTSQAAENFNHLFRRAFAATIVRMNVTSEERQLTDDEEMLWGGMLNIADLDILEAHDMLDSLTDLPGQGLFTIDAENMQEALLTLICLEMIAVLVRLPYRDLLLRPSAREFRDLLRSAKSPQGYFSDEFYDVGDLIEHPTFGNGKVVKVRDTKITVKFRDGIRMLIHASNIVD